MGFRFHKSVKLFPGFRLNFSKSGTSLSVGGRGATVNFSDRGTRTTLSLPGTGLSYVSTSGASRAHRASASAVPAQPAPRGRLLVVAGVVGALVVYNVHGYGQASAGMDDVRAASLAPPPAPHPVVPLAATAPAAAAHKTAQAGAPVAVHHRSHHRHKGR
jgi:hypothetical protein